MGLFEAFDFVPSFHFFSNNRYSSKFKWMLKNKKIKVTIYLTAQTLVFYFTKKNRKE